LAAIGWWIWAAQLQVPASAVLNALWFAIPLLTVSLVAILLRDQRNQGSQNSDEAGRAVAGSSGKGQLAALISQLEAAAESADWQDLQPSQSTIRSELAVLQSAFASLRKAHKFVTPELSQQTAASMARGVAYLRQVLPFLRAGHVEEAKEAARQFVQA
jgi:hypothetical protein